MTTVAGEGQSHVDSATAPPAYPGEEPEHVEYEVFTLFPRFIDPAPALFAIPEKCHEDIRDELQRCFSLFWCDWRAAANSLRTVVERLLDAHKVPRRLRGEKSALPLPGRIRKFKEKYPKYETLASSLIAVKLIGDPASHTENISRDELCNALAIIDHALDEIYSLTERRKTTSTLVSAIHRKRGRRKKRTKKKTKPSAHE